MKNKLYLVQKVIDRIEQNLDEPINVTLLAQESGISQWEFQRLFRALVGDSLGNYLRQRRLTKSLELLKESQLRILDIAIQFQFSSQEAYARSFKSYFGETPSSVRKNNISLETRKKPILSQELVSHISKRMTLTPKIVTRPKTILIGLETKIPSYRSDYLNYDEILVPHWEQFLTRLSEIKRKKNNLKFGLGQSDSYNSEDNSHSYLAAVEVEGVECVPSDMIVKEIPQMTYAVFSNKGTGDKTSYTINYIYGIWLLQSDYERAHGDDFEIFGDKYEIKNENSISEYYLPVTLK